MNTTIKKIEELFNIKLTPSCRNLDECGKCRGRVERREKLVKLFTSQKNHSLQEQKKQLREKVEALPVLKTQDFNDVPLLNKKDILKFLED